MASGRRQGPGVAGDLEQDRVVGRHEALLDHADERAHDLEEGHFLAGLVRQRLVHECDRTDAAHRLLDGGLGLGRRQAPTLQAQQRRDRLQVVLHPVVDLADGGVLGHEQPVASAQLRDVAEQHEPARHPPVVEQRDAPDQQRDLVPALDLLGRGPTRGEGHPHRVLVQPELGEQHALGVEMHADAMERGHGVRRRVLNPSRLVEQDHAVADAGASSLRASGPGKGNSPDAIIRANRLNTST